MGYTLLSINLAISGMVSLLSSSLVWGSMILIIWVDGPTATSRVCLCQDVLVLIRASHIQWLCLGALLESHQKFPREDGEGEIYFLCPTIESTLFSLPPLEFSISLCSAFQESIFSMEFPTQQQGTKPAMCSKLCSFLGHCTGLHSRDTANNPKRCS